MLLTFMMVGFNAGCVTRTTRHAASTRNSGQGRTEEDGKILKTETIWIWEKEFRHQKNK